MALITNILNFINTNMGLITLLVGSFAIGIYIRQKREHRRNVAKLILQEIRYAEQNIKIARERKDVFLLSIKLLPTNSWYNNIHLFVNDLKETEIDIISHFYSKTEYIDHVIEAISTHKLNSKIPVNPPQTIPQINLQQMDSDNQGTNTPTANQPTILLTEFQLAAEAILKDVTSQVQYLYNTPAAERLRSISEKKWYHIL